MISRDRPSKTLVYNDNVGPVSGIHYHKMCNGCTQYYGYFTKWLHKVFYNHDYCHSLYLLMINVLTKLIK